MISSRHCGERSDEAIQRRGTADALDALEAAQAVAERDCGLQVAAMARCGPIFFASNRDPMLSLLVESHPMPAQAIAQRAAALADRQRALGRAVADAAQELDAKLGPDAIEAETKGRFRRGPLASIAAWERYVGLHAEIGWREKRRAELFDAAAKLLLARSTETAVT